MEVWTTEYEGFAPYFWRIWDRLHTVVFWYVVFVIVRHVVFAYVLALLFFGIAVLCVLVIWGD